MGTSHLGIIGLGIMGRNLALNAEGGPALLFRRGLARAGSRAAKS